MTLRPAGEARLDLLTDGLLLEIGDDLYVVPLHRLAALTSRRSDYAPVSRRYPGTGGRHLDVEIQYTLRRSCSGSALVLWTPGGIYIMSLAAVLDVEHSMAPSAEISRIEMDVAQLETDGAGWMLNGWMLNGWMLNGGL